MELVIKDSPVEADGKEIVTKAEDFVAKITELTIENDEDFTQAGEWEQALREMLKQVDKVFDPPIEKLKSALQEMRNEKLQHSHKIDHAVHLLKPKLVRYLETRKKVTEVEVAIEASEEDQKSKAQREQLAKALRDAGLNDEADALLAAPSTTVATRTPPPPKIHGFRYRTNWTFSVFCKNCKKRVLYKDFKLHARHDLAVDTIPDEYWAVNWVAINKVVKDKMDKAEIPGVTVHEEKV